MKHQFRNPIPGQLEVAGVDKGTTDDQIWIVKEGLFFPDATYKDL